MKKYVCAVCGWVYDEELGDVDNGIEPGTAFGKYLQTSNGDDEERNDGRIY